jgi:hypothetical protein
MRGRAATGTALREDLADWRGELRSVWLRVWIAANKALALLFAVGIHKVLDIAGEWLIPPGWESCSKLFHGTFFVVFMVIYLHFLWEMLAVFVPSLKGRGGKEKGKRT